MLFHVVHRHAEFAAPPIQIERTRLKNGFGLGRVKVVERHEVVYEGEQITIVADELV